MFNNITCSPQGHARTCTHTHTQASRYTQTSGTDTHTHKCTEECVRTHTTLPIHVLWLFSYYILLFTATTFKSLPNCFVCENLNYNKALSDSDFSISHSMQAISPSQMQQFPCWTCGKVVGFATGQRLHYETHLSH